MSLAVTIECKYPIYDNKLKDMFVRLNPEWYALFFATINNEKYFQHVRDIFIGMPEIDSKYKLELLGMETV